MILAFDIGNSNIVETIANVSLNGYLLHNIPKQIQVVTTIGKKKCTSKSVNVTCNVIEEITQKTVSNDMSTMPNNIIRVAYICCKE